MRTTIDIRDDLMQELQLKAVQEKKTLKESIYHRKAKAWLEETVNNGSDAHLAALALENDATLVTCDRDFLRFPGLKVHLLF